MEYWPGLLLSYICDCQGLRPRLKYFLLEVFQNLYCGFRWCFFCLEFSSHSLHIVWEKEGFSISYFAILFNVLELCFQRRLKVWETVVLFGSYMGWLLLSGLPIKHDESQILPCTWSLKNFLLALFFVHDKSGYGSPSGLMHKLDNIPSINKFLVVSHSWCTIPIGTWVFQSQLNQVILVECKKKALIVLTLVVAAVTLLLL